MIPAAETDGGSLVYRDNMVLFVGVISYIGAKIFKERIGNA